MHEIRDMLKVLWLGNYIKCLQIDEILGHFEKRAKSKFLKTEFPRCEQYSINVFYCNFYIYMYAMGLGHKFSQR